MNRVVSVCLAVPLLAFTASAASFYEDVNGISALGTNFLLNTASTGGGDWNATGTPRTGLFTRDLALNVGTGGSLVSLTGLAFALPAAGNTNGNVLTATITYLGGNGTFGGGDDVLFGSTKARLDYSTGAGIYVWNFDSALTQSIDGAGTKFRIALESLEVDNGGNTYSFRFKTTSTSALNAADVKITVAGTSVAVVPEPSVLALAGLGIAGLWMCRRR